MHLSRIFCACKHIDFYLIIIFAWSQLSINGFAALTSAWALICVHKQIFFGYLFRNMMLHVVLWISHLGSLVVEMWCIMHVLSGNCSCCCGRCRRRWCGCCYCCPRVTVRQSVKLGYVTSSTGSRAIVRRWGNRSTNKLGLKQLQIIMIIIIRRLIRRRKIP